MHATPGRFERPVEACLACAGCVGSNMGSTLLSQEVHGRFGTRKACLYGSTKAPTVDAFPGFANGLQRRTFKYQTPRSRDTSPVLRSEYRYERPWHAV